MCACVAAENRKEEEEKSDWARLPNQRKKTEASGEKGERVGRIRKEREMTDQSKKGKGGKEGRRERMGSAGSHPRPASSTSDPEPIPAKFLQFSGEIRTTIP